jgi:hypothetical protein
MHQKMILQIVPALRPQSDGAGDYALKLALELRESYNIESRFIVCDPKWNGSGRIEDFVVQRLRIRSEAGIWSLLSSNKLPDIPVLFHYCPYGYQKQGVPLWMYRGIKSWLGEQGSPAASGDKRLFTVFYGTLPSSAKPWKKATYLRIPQQWLLQEFHRCSKLSVTGCGFMQNLLESVKPGKTLLVPMPGEKPLWYAENPDWKLIGSQFQAELFVESSYPKTGVQLNGDYAQVIKDQAQPIFNLGHHAEERPIAIRPRQV